MDTRGERRPSAAALLGGVTAVALVIRLFRLDYFSYGLDEILQGYFIQGTWDSFWKSLKFDAVHPPLDYLVARFVEAFRPAAWARKVPDVVWGTATVPVLGLLIGRRAGRAAGTVTAVLLAVAPFHVRYSQEFRPYALSLFLLCLSLLLLDHFLERGRAWRLVVLWLACLATAYTLYFAALVLAIAAATMLADDAFSSHGEEVRRLRARRLLLWSPVFCLALFLAYLPWWPVVVEAGRRAPMAERAAVTLGRADRTMSYFLFATEGDQPLGLAGGLYFLFVITGLPIALRRPGLRFLASWAVGGFAAIELVGQIHPHYDFVRRFLPAGIALVPLAGLAIAWLLRRPGGRRTAALALAAIVLLDARSLSRYFREGRADWRPLAEFLKSRPAQEQVFTENQYAQLCTAFYTVGASWAADGGRAGRQIPNLDGELARLTYSWAPGTTAWLILAGQPEHPEVREWARQFQRTPFPTAERAILVKLDPALREKALAGPLPPPRR